MLMTVFRKYQRYIFVVITFVIVISFSFFGTFQLNWGNKKKNDRVVATTVDGKQVKQSDLALFSYFLAPHGRKKQLGKLFHDDVIVKDFLETKVAHLLVKEYLCHLKPQMEQSFEKTRNFIPYHHPSLSFLSAKKTWHHLAPKLYSHFEKLKQCKEFTLDTFEILVDLYLAQEEFPPEMLKRVLLFQEEKLANHSFDPYLAHADLSLFGFQSIEDWFGQNFIDLMSEFIINVAGIAEKKGYVVSNQEALFDLIKNFSETLQKLDPSKKEGKNYFYPYLEMLGLSEKNVIHIWRKVLLFRRYFQDVQQGVFVDTLPFENINTYAQKTALIDMYELPSYLHLKNFQDLMLLQTYLRAVSPVLSSTEQEFSLDLTNIYYPLDEIEKKNPQLVEQCCRVQVKSITLDEVALRIKEKELWDWQTQDRNFFSLCSQFSDLAEKKEIERDKRFSVLEDIEKNKRQQIDKWSREKIILEHPKWITEALQNVSVNEYEWALRKKNSSISLPGIYKPDQLAHLLLSQKKEENDPLQNPLLAYSEDNKYYYSIEVIQKDENKHLVSFHDALKEGILQKMLDALLEERYFAIREDHPNLFQKENEVWRHFSEVKEEIGRFLFCDILQAIDRDNEKREGKLLWKYGEGPLDFYTSHYLFPYVQKIREVCMQSGENMAWIQNEAEPLDKLAEQWKLEKKMMKVKRSTKEEWLHEALFLQKEMSWSDIHIGRDGNLTFFRFLQWETDTSLFSDQIKKVQEQLAHEAVLYFAEELIENIKDKKGIVLPLHKDLESTIE